MRLPTDDVFSLSPYYIGNISWRTQIIPSVSCLVRESERERDVNKLLQFNVIDITVEVTYNI